MNGLVAPLIKELPAAPCNWRVIFVELEEMVNLFNLEWQVDLPAHGDDCSAVGKEAAVYGAVLKLSPTLSCSVRKFNELACLLGKTWGQRISVLHCCVLHLSAQKALPSA